MIVEVVKASNGYIVMEKTDRENWLDSAICIEFNGPDLAKRLGEAIIELTGGSK